MSGGKLPILITRKNFEFASKLCFKPQAVEKQDALSWVVLSAPQGSSGVVRE
jgi:hypothetical protein